MGVEGQLVPADHRPSLAGVHAVPLLGVGAVGHVSVRPRVPCGVRHTFRVPWLGSGISCLRHTVAGIRPRPFLDVVAEQATRALLRAGGSSSPVRWRARAAVVVEDLPCRAPPSSGKALAASIIRGEVAHLALAERLARIVAGDQAGYGRAVHRRGHRPSGVTGQRPPISSAAPQRFCRSARVSCSSAASASGRSRTRTSRRWRRRQICVRASRRP